MDKYPYISIIIPVYNLENYISNCLDSILNQSFRDIEIICVNDGSTDNSLKILREYSHKDNRIRVYDKPNEGSGKARNLGILMSRGMFTLFVDGDDLLCEDALFEMFHKALSSDTDILVFGGYTYYNKKKYHAGTYSYEKIPHKYTKRIFSSDDIKKDIFKFPSPAWTKLYKTEFIKINNIKFQDIRAGQDQLFFFHSMNTAKKIAVLEKNLYFYRKNRPGSVTSVKKKNNFSPIYTFYSVEKLLKQNGKLDEYKNIFITRYLSKSSSWLAKYEPEKKENYYNEYIKMLSYIKSRYPDGWWIYFKPSLNDGYLALKTRIFISKLLYIGREFEKAACERQTWAGRILPHGNR